MLRNLKNHPEKNERTCQRKHVQIHGYANKSEQTYVQGSKYGENAFDRT